jgi:hypothetical protein
MNITLDDFKKLLLSLKEKNIKLRIKTITGWSQRYLSVLGFTHQRDTPGHDFKGIILSDEMEKEGMLLTDLTHLVAFQLETSYDKFKAKTVHMVLTYSFQAVS